MKLLRRRSKDLSASVAEWCDEARYVRDERVGISLEAEPSAPPERVTEAERAAELQTRAWWDALPYAAQTAHAAYRSAR